MKKSELVQNALILIYAALDCIEVQDVFNQNQLVYKLVAIKTRYGISFTENDKLLIHEACNG